MMIETVQTSKTQHELAVAITGQACSLLTAELVKRGAIPSAAENRDIFYVGQPGIEHVISCPIPADSQVVIKDDLACWYDIEGAALEDITPAYLSEWAAQLAEHIAQITKTPRFGWMYKPQAVEATEVASDGFVILRLIRAFDVIHCCYVTRIDCVFGKS